METVWAKGIKIHKSQAQEVLQKLKSRGAIHTQLLIARTEEFVIIPILKDIEEYDMVEWEFAVKQSKPKSIKEAMLKLLPDIDPSILQSSFDQVGDIAIIDIKTELLKYKYHVAQAILDTHPSVNAVFRKSSAVDGALRIRGVEHIGGENRTFTVHKEYGIKIYVDIAKAYYSPRLSTEHRRVAIQCKDGETILDLFGSLAPFALHIAKLHKATILTNDINPQTRALIEQSIQHNTLKGKIIISIEDAHELMSRLKAENTKFNRIIMNHPSGAEHFIKRAIELIEDGGRVYYYRFVPIEGMEVFCKDHVATLAHVKLVNIHVVRQYSPSEYHVCMEIEKVPDQIAHQ